MNKELQIEASLNHGRYYSKNWIVFSYIILIMSIVLIPLLICCAIIVNEYLILLNLLLSVLGIIGCLCIILNNLKLTRIIKLCLSDFVKVEATAERLDITSINYKPYQIGVYFTLNGQKYFKTNAVGSIFGSHKEFIKYVGKKINILYSPKYDEVMILKD